MKLVKRKTQIYFKMNNKNQKNLLLGFAALFAITILSSCSRGGYGCPYELEAASNILQNIIIK